MDDKRKAIIKAYPGPDWANKVLRMSDAQVTAIYLNLKRKGLI